MKVNLLGEEYIVTFGDVIKAIIAAVGFLAGLIVIGLLFF